MNVVQATARWNDYTVVPEREASLYVKHDRDLTAKVMKLLIMQ